MTGQLRPLDEFSIFTSKSFAEVSIFQMFPFNQNLLDVSISLQKLTFLAVLGVEISHIPGSYLKV